METAKLRIVADTPPANIIAHATLKAEAHPPIKRVVAAAAPRRRSRHLDVDAILSRSLPKLSEVSRRPQKLVNPSL